MASLQDVSTALQNIAQNLGRLVAQTALTTVVSVAQGGTGATTEAGARANLGVQGAPILAGSLAAANFNSTSDQPITISIPTGYSKWQIDTIRVSHPSTSLTTAVGGIYSGAGKTGVQIVSAAQAYSALTTGTANTSGSAMSATVSNVAEFNLTTIYLSLSTPQGGAATADVNVWIRPYT